MDTVSLPVVVACLVACVATTVVPILVSVVLLARKVLNVRPYFVGVLAFFVSQIVLRVPILNVLYSVSEGFNTFCSSLLGGVLVGGLSAGLFEETARLIGAKALKKRGQLTFRDGVSFGIGHALCEVVLLVGVSYVCYLVAFTMVNAGTFHTVMVSAGVTEEQYQEYLQMYTSVQPIDYAYGLVERCSAVAIHVSNTLLVFYAVRHRRYGYYALAVLLHTAFNGLAVVLSAYCGYLTIEAVLLLFAAALLYLTVKKSRADTRV